MPVTLGARLRAALLQAGRTDAWLAQQLNYPLACVGAWVEDAIRPPQETLGRITRLLEVPDDWFAEAH